MRPDAERYIRPDAHRFMPPGAPRWLGKDAVRYFWPEHKTQPARAHHDETEQARDDAFLRELAARRDDLLRLRRELAAINAELKFRRFVRALRAGFNPSQPRVPRGSPDGGQWTSDGGGGGEGSGRNDPRILSDASPDNDWQPGAQYAQNRARGGSILINGRMVTPTPGQAVRLAVAEARATEAINRVREIDPNWRPSPSAYESVEGLISAREADARHMRVSLSCNATGLGRVRLLATRSPRAGQSETTDHGRLNRTTKMARFGAATRVVRLILAHARATMSSTINRRRVGIPGGFRSGSSRNARPAVLGKAVGLLATEERVR